MITLHIQGNSVTDLRQICISEESDVLELKTQLTNEFEDLKEISVDDISLSFEGPMENRKRLKDYMLGDESRIQLVVLPPADVFCGGCKQGFRLFDPFKQAILLQCGDTVCTSCYCHETVVEEENPSDDEDASANSMVHAAKDKNDGDTICFICPYDNCGRISYRLKTTSGHNHTAMTVLLSELAAKRDVAETTDQETVQLCFACEESPATKCCDICKHSHCDECDAQMHSIRKMSEHKRVPVELNGAMVCRPIMCSIHVDESCEHYCLCDDKRCDLFVCSKCITVGGAHSGHGFGSIHDAAVKKKVALTDQMAAVLMKENELKQVADELKSIMEAVKNYSEESIAVTNERYDRIIKCLEVKKAETINQIAQHRHDKEKRCIESLESIAVKLGELNVERKRLELITQTLTIDDDNNTTTNNSNNNNNNNNCNDITNIDSRKQSCHVTCRKNDVAVLKVRLFSESINELLSISYTDTRASVCIPSAKPNVMLNQLKAADEPVMMDILNVMGGLPAPTGVSVNEFAATAATICWNPMIQYHVQLRSVDNGFDDEVEENKSQRDVDWPVVVYSGCNSEVTAGSLVGGRHYEVRVCGEYVNNGFGYRSPWTGNTFLVNAFAGLSWNNNAKNPNVVINGDKVSVPAGIAEKKDGWGTTSTSTGLKIVPNSDGWGYFEVVMGSWNANGVVGLVSSNFSFDQPHHCGAGSGVSFGWLGFSHEGKCSSTRPELQLDKDPSRSFGKGDVVGILVKCRGNPSMSWYVNKKRVYNCVFPTSLHNITLFPAVSIGNIVDTMTLVKNPDITE